MASPVNDYSGSPRPLYRYRNLPLQSIRLLHLEPGSFDDDIAIWLEPALFRLEEESGANESRSDQRPEPSQYRGSLIKYEALSYVWGPKEKPLAISIEDGVTGWRVPPGNAPALASALTRAVSAPGALAAMGEAARAMVLTRYGPPAFRAAGNAVVARLKRLG